MKKADRELAPNRSLVKVAVTAVASASMEWYDFFIYGTAAAIVFPQLFFSPTLPPIVAQFAAFGAFAVGFIARPLGGAAFGHFGDLYGRKRALVTALIIMGLATTSIGLLPTYKVIGWFAPLLLVLLRFIQGIAVGGQWGGAALMVIENAPADRKGFFGSLVQTGTVAGLLMANLAFWGVGSLISHTAFEAWGWRLPFLFSFALVALGLYAHLTLEDSPEFRELQEKGGGEVRVPRRSPLIDAVLNHWGTIVLAGGAFIASNCSFYMINVYAIGYGVRTLGLSQNTMLVAVMIGGVLSTPAILYFAALSDRVGRRGLFMLGALCTGLFAFALFPMIGTGSLWVICLAMILAQVCVSLMFGPQPALFAELFTPEVRYSGASLGYQIGAVFGGGFAPLIAIALFAQFKSSLALSAYMFGMCMVSLVCTAALAMRASSGAARSSRLNAEG